jgi:hypothetical protein
MNAVTVPATQCGFEELGLQAGDRLQLEIRSAGALPRTYSTYLIGHIPSASLLIRTPLSQGFPLDIGAGDAVEVKFFSGRHHCSFGTWVMRHCRAPVHYLHLVYPECVQRVLLRDTLRVRVNLPGTAESTENAVQRGSVPISVTDLSVSGARVDTNRELGLVGDATRIGFKFFVQPNHYLVNFETKATIRSSRDAESGSAQHGLRYGLKFGTMHATEGVLLQSYLHQILIADRSRVA